MIYFRDVDGWYHPMDRIVRFKFTGTGSARVILEGGDEVEAGCSEMEIAMRRHEGEVIKFERSE